MTPSLTPTQVRVLDYLAQYSAVHQSMPTRAQIASNFGWKSANSAEEHVQALCRRGVVQIVKGTSRGVRITEAGRKALGLPSALPAVTPGNVPMLRLPVYDMRWPGALLTGRFS